MIKLQKYTPDVYYNESRDFQLIGRLYDIVLNYVKTNVDLLYNLPLSDDMDDQFVGLLGLTLGFKPKHKYTSKHLKAICSVLAQIMKYKGTVKAVTLACNAIFQSEGSRETSDCVLDGTTLNIYFPADFSDNNLLNDLLDYILPAGMSVNIIKVVSYNKLLWTDISTGSTIKQYTPVNNYRDNSIPRDISNDADIAANANALANMLVYKPVVNNDGDD